jgi:hypothetical protein
MARMRRMGAAALVGLSVLVIAPDALCEGIAMRPDSLLKEASFLGMRFTYRPPQPTAPKARVSKVGNVTFEWPVLSNDEVRD